MTICWPFVYRISHNQPKVTLPKTNKKINIQPIIEVSVLSATTPPSHNLFDWMWETQMSIFLKTFFNDWFQSFMVIFNDNYSLSHIGL